MAVATLAALGPLSVAVAIGLGSISSVAEPASGRRNAPEVPPTVQPATDVPGLPPSAEVPTGPPAAPDLRRRSSRNVSAPTEPEGPGDPLEPHRLLISPRVESDAPLPGEATRFLKDEPKKKGWKYIPRALLFVPKWAIELGTYPVYLTIIAYRKYAVKERVVDVFFNEERTFGVFPTIFAETGFGANIGVRLVHTDLFGQRESLRLRAGWGGRWRQVYEAQLGTGDRLSEDAKLRVFGRYEILPRQRFFGLGNDDELDLTPTEADAFEPIDPVQRWGAVDTRYRADVAMWGGDLALGIGEHGTARFGHRWQWARFDDPVGTSGAVELDEVYDVTVLAGWTSGLLNHYSELSLEYDDTQTVYPWQPRQLPSKGWRLRAYGGFAEAPNDPTQYFTSGFDAQRYVDLFKGDRVLSLRLAADAIHGLRRHIPFTDYPSLGGPDLLRGYTRDRFRDRFATVASVQYNYPINEVLGGYLFVDTGRVWPRPYMLHVDGLRQLRLGFGGGLNVILEKTFVGRIQAAGSIDGGFFLDFRLNPTGQIRRSFWR